MARWREEMIVPIVKKGERKEMEDYRGVTLMPMIYKIYTIVLVERLRKEVEEKGIVPKNQMGFRNMQLERKAGKDGDHVCRSEGSF